MQGVVGINYYKLSKTCSKNIKNVAPHNLLSASPTHFPHDFIMFSWRVHSRCILWNKFYITFIASPRPQPFP